MNPTWEDPIGEDEDDENAYEKGFVQGRDAVIFLIDASEAMFKVHEEEAPFQQCLKCARATLTNKIISSNKDLVGIVLFGTEKTKNNRNDTDFKHIYIFQDLGEPGAERILETEELMSLNSGDFASKYGHSEDFSLADAFWSCGIMFSNCKYTLAHRRILLFTINDNPHAGKPQLQIQAKTKAKDLHEFHIDIDVFPIKIPDTSFDYSLFYKEVVSIAEDEQQRFADPSEKFDDLLLRVRCKDHRKRPLGNLEFTLGEDVKIAFKMYKLVVPATKPYPVKLAKENNAEVSMVTNTYLADTGEVLLPSSLRKFQEYGEKKIYVTQDEVKQIRHFDNPGLLLMGFKPKSCLKIHYHHKPSTFLYPDEKAIQGSVRLCSALIQQCHKRGYVPICRMIARQSDPPKFVALLPQLEHTDDLGNQTIPPGFHTIYLPFMEDIRCLNVEKKKHNSSEALVEKSKEIIKKLQFAYQPDTFENPVLQKHWRNIEALALNRDAPEEIIDYTLPTKDVIEKRAGKLIEEFKALLCPSASSQGASLKRGASSPGCGTPAKSAKTEEVIPACLQQEAANGMLQKYKVAVLKEFCKRNGIRCGTKKADLVDEITKFYQQHPQSQ